MKFGGLMRSWTLAAALTLAASGGAVAAQETGDSSAEDATEAMLLEPALRERYWRLARELRCPKCPNQSIEESAAVISVDLRRKLRMLLTQGLEDEEILSRMADSYGNFVRYRPPFAGEGRWLWSLPPLLLLVGILALWRVLRVRWRSPPAAATEEATSAACASPVEPRTRGLAGGWLAMAVALAALLGAGVYWKTGAWEQWWLLRQTRILAQSAAPLPPETLTRRTRLIWRLADYHRRHPQEFPPGLLLVTSGGAPELLGELVEAYTALAERHPEDRNLRTALAVFQALRARPDARAKGSVDVEDES